VEQATLVMCAKSWSEHCQSAGFVFSTLSHSPEGNIIGFTLHLGMLLDVFEGIQAGAQGLLTHFPP
jgi:hypothetical protein